MISSSCFFFLCCFFFFFNDTATTEIYTLSLHDALPISHWRYRRPPCPPSPRLQTSSGATPARDRKSTRLNSSHVSISYADFSLTKKMSATIQSFFVSLASVERISNYRTALY